MVHFELTFVQGVQWEGGLSSFLCGNYLPLFIKKILLSSYKTVLTSLLKINWPETLHFILSLILNDYLGAILCQLL